MCLVVVCRLYTRSTIIVLRSIVLIVPTARHCVGYAVLGEAQQGAEYGVFLLRELRCVIVIVFRLRLTTLDRLIAILVLLVCLQRAIKSFRLNCSRGIYMLQRDKVPFFPHSSFVIACV